MEKNATIELEHLELWLDSRSGKKTLVMVPLAGSARLGFYGTLTSTNDDELNPMFTITRSDVPSPALSFYGKDIHCVRNINTEDPVVVLNKLVNMPQMYE